MNRVGIVVIGRNEGERLRACLESISARESGVTNGSVIATTGTPLVYVDSGSTDGSVELARSLGAEVVELDMGRPFSAARRRNEGFARLREISPSIKYVQFVDGDCSVTEDWLDAAVAFLDEHTDYAVACGRRHERFPERSVYNRLCDIEWNTPVGDADSCGGDAMIRVSAFAHMGGYNPDVVAGEEPELCLRLRNAGWKIRRLDAEMALHDAAMTHFAQWWKRAVRGGYGGTDVALRFEKGHGAFSRRVRSARLWGVGWPLAVLIITGMALAFCGWRMAIAAALLSLAILPAQMVRIGIRSLRKSDPRTALTQGFLTVLGKWAHLLGQYRYWRDRRSGRHLSLIEYKQPAEKNVVVHV